MDVQTYRIVSSIRRNEKCLVINRCWLLLSERICAKYAHKWSDLIIATFINREYKYIIIIRQQLAVVHVLVYCTAIC